MSIPVSKIETYTGDTLDHTLQAKANQIYVKQVLTDGVGIFCFSLSIKKQTSYGYTDIALHDKVKIWLACTIASFKNMFP